MAKANQEINKFAAGFFFDDSPKKNVHSDDRLGFKPLAKRLADSLIGMQSKEGFVVGLHGEWGSGKSTLFNFVQNFLEKHNQEVESEDGEILFLDFRPWLLTSDRASLTGAYFKVLTEALQKPRTTANKLAGMLRASANFVDPVIDAAATLGAAIDFSGGLASKTAAEMLKGAVSGRKAQWETQPSIQSSYLTLHRQLAEGKRQIVVFIDDIDRLPPEEVRETMAMVKSIGKLPYVTYVLGYDRQLVWSSLDDQALSEGGKHYAEKIVQHELELPLPTFTGLFQVFAGAADEYMTDAGRSDRFDRMVREGAPRWIKTPRAATRLANAINYNWSALRGEVDGQDLFALEGMRLYERDAYDWVRRSGDFFFSKGRFAWDKDARKRYAEAFQADMNAKGKDYIVTIIASLFPMKSGEFSGKSSVLEPHYTQMSRFGVSTESGFQAYFRGDPPTNGLSLSRFEELIKRLDDSVFLITEFRAALELEGFGGTNLITDLLERILMRRYDKPQTTPLTQALFEALVSVGEEVIQLQPSGGNDLFGPSTWLAGLLQEIIHSNQPQSEKWLLGSIESAPSVSFLSWMVGRVTQLTPEADAEKHLPYESDATAKMRQMLAMRIEESATNGALREIRPLWPVLLAWRHVSGPERVRGWVAETLPNTPSLLRHLPVFSREVSTGTPSLSSDFDKEVYDIQLLTSVANDVLSNLGSDADLRRHAKAIIAGPDRFIDEDRRA